MTYRRAPITIGNFSQRPVVGSKAGSIHYLTDGPTTSIYDGTNWRPLISGTMGTYPPAASNWTQVNQAGRTTSFVDYNGGLRISSTNGTTGVDIRCAYIAAPSSHWQMTAHILPGIPNALNVFGIGVRNSTNGSLLTCGHVINTSSTMQKHRLTADNNGTSPTISQNSAVNIFSTPYVTTMTYGMWLRVQNDGTNVIFNYSTDGVNFMYLDQETLATFIGTADQAIIYIFYSDSNQQPNSAVYDSILLESLP